MVLERSFREQALSLDDYAYEVRLRVMAAQLYAANNIGAWCIWWPDGPDKEKRVFSTCVYEKEFQDFLELGGCLDFMGEKEGGYDTPVVLSDSLGLTWVAEHTFGEILCEEPFSRRKELLVIIGPMFMSSTSLHYIEKALGEKINSVQVRRQMIRTLTEVPVMNASAIVQYGKIMHYSITGAMVSASQFIYQNDQIPLLSQQEESASLDSDLDYDRIHRGEQMALSAVREGNLKYKEIMEKELSYYDHFISQTGDDLRDGKNSVLVFTALCSRAAQEGGLPPKAANETERRYYTEIEKCRTIPALKNVMNRMMHEFVTRVAGIRDNPAASKSIRECCDYIRVNVLKDLTVDEIASEMGYSPYYFSRKFNREMGIKVGDYIKQVKIEYAKVALFTTNRSIQEISDSLKFSSRNYFTKVFTSIVGTTPAAYRNQITGAEGGQEHAT